MAKYGKKAASSVKRAVKKKKKGTLKSGKSGKKVFKSQKQAIANWSIGGPKKMGQGSKEEKGETEKVVISALSSGARGIRTDVDMFLSSSLIENDRTK